MSAHRLVHDLAAYKQELAATPVAIAATAVAVAIPTWILLKRAFRRYVIFNTTALDDLPGLSEPVTHAKHGTVIIAGGSIAGLMTARVCSAHFKRVIIVEPETWALSDEARQVAAPAPTDTREVIRDGVAYNTLAHKRTRIAQYSSVHGYQGLILNILRGLFPGFDDLSKRHGVRIAEADFNYFLDGFLLNPHDKKRDGPLPETIFCSRRVLERTLRDVVHDQCPDVEYTNGTVTDIKLSDDTRTVTSAAVRLVDGSSTNIECDMFVDCTGTSQAGLKWLSRALPTHAANRLTAIKQEYQVQINFSSIEFPAPPNFIEKINKLETLKHSGTEGQKMSLDAWFINWTPLSPSNDFRTVFGGKRENGDIVVGGGGPESETPVSLDQLREYSRKALVHGKQPPKFWFDILDLLEPVKDQAVAYDGKIRACSRLLYENVGDILPRNFIALGDSTMRLNPRLGEGITKCAIAVVTLDGELRRHPRGPQDPKFAPSFFNLAASRTGGIWDGERNSDYGHPSATPTPGTNLKDGSFVRWYLKTLARVASRDAGVGGVLLDVFQFLAPGADILAPSIFCKVLWEHMAPSKPA